MSEQRHPAGTIDRQPADHIRWRARLLERAGFARPLAAALAGDTRIDLHALLELVDRGCPPPLAARILAPIDGPGGGAA